MGKSVLTLGTVSFSRVVSQVVPGGLRKGQEAEANIKSGARPAKGGKGP